MSNILQYILMFGSNSLGAFGGMYEGGGQIQQVPQELTDTIIALQKQNRTFENYLEIGAASGGTTHMLNRFLNINNFYIIDTNRHPTCYLRDDNLKEIKNKLEFIGDSHSVECEDWLKSLNKKFDFAFIDGDHRYEGVTQDLELVINFLNDNAVIMLHDIEVCAGVKNLHNDIVNNKYPLIECDDVFIEKNRPYCGIGLYLYNSHTV